MQLNKKKALASKVLKVGKNRILFAEGHEGEIKEAITRQDILDLYKSGSIKIKEIKGRRKNIKRKHRRGQGKVKKKCKRTKQDYVNLTRKLRKSARLFFKQGKIDKDKKNKIRKFIKASRFKSKRHLLESMEEI